MLINKAKNRIYGIVLVVLSLLLYANTINHGYVLDDALVITDNHYVKQGVKAVPVLFTTSQLKGHTGNIATDKYRPLSLVMFAVEYELFGLNPMPGHLLNILLYAVCVLLFFGFLIRFFGKEKILPAFIAALIFAVHPVHSEVVANIKSRDELLCFLFAILSLNMLMRYADTGRRGQLIWGGILLFTATLAKETAATFAAIIPLIFFFYKNENRKRSIHIMWAMAGAYALFFAIRMAVLWRNDAAETVDVRLVYNLLAMAPDAASALATEIAILGKYLALLVAPHPLLFFYGQGSIPIYGWGDLWPIVAGATYVALAGIAVYRLMKNSKDILSFGILFYLVTIMLHSNIFVTIGTAFANRFAFFPSVGYCICVAVLFDKWVLRGRTSVKVAALMLPVVVVYAVLTVQRNADWESEQTLFMADVQKSPGDAWLQYYAGLQLQKAYNEETNSARKEQLNEESLEHLSKSLEVYAGNSEAHADIGVAYLHNNEMEEAERHLRRALELNPVHAHAAENLATLYFMQKDYAVAVPYYERALSIDSASDMAVYNLGVCHAMLNNYDKAIYCFKRTIEITPAFDGYKSYANIAMLYHRNNIADSAARYEQIAKQYLPGFHL